MTQLRDLAEPFPDRLVKQAPQGKYGSYVAHSTVTERLLSIVGPFTQRVVEILRDPSDNDVVCGVVLELEVNIDGRVVVIQEAGDCERPSNWNTDGARLKDAVSDAVKRCAMRLGLGLHLWSQSDYFLDKQLDHDAESGPRITRVKIGDVEIPPPESSRGGGEPAEQGSGHGPTPTQGGTMHQKVFGEDHPTDPDVPTLDEMVLGDE